MDEKLKAISSIEKIISKAGECIEGLRESATSVNEVAKSVIHDIDEINSEVVHQLYQAKQALRDVKRLVSKGYRFIDRVNEVFYYWSKLAMDVNLVMNEIKKGNMTTLNTFISKIQQKLSVCIQLHREYMEEANETQRIIDKAAAECDRKAAEAERKKITAQVMGGTAAVGGVLIGMVVGGPVGGVIAGAVATTTTIAIAEQYNSAAESFRGIGKYFAALDKTTQNTIDKIQDLERALNNFGIIIDEVENTIHQQQQQWSFITLISRVFKAQDDKEIFVHLERLITRGGELYGSLNIQ